MKLPSIERFAGRPIDRTTIQGVLVVIHRRYTIEMTSENGPVTYQVIKLEQDSKGTWLRLVSGKVDIRIQSIRIKSISPA